MRDHSRSSITSGSSTERAAEGVLIGAQRTGQHLGIAAVVLGAGNAEAITKAVELPGVDGKDLKAAFQQRLDHGAARRLDRRCDLRRLRSGLLHQPRAQLRQLGAAMRDVALGDALALGIKQADAVLRARPIDTDKPTNLVTHPFHLQSAAGLPRPFVDPCTGARGADLLLDVGRGRSTGAHVLRRCSRHRWALVAPGRSARGQSTSGLAPERHEGYRVGKFAPCSAAWWARRDREFAHHANAEIARLCPPYNA